MIAPDLKLLALVRADIQALHELKLITRAQSHALIVYVDTHREEVANYCESMKTHEVVDLLRDLLRI